MPNYPRVTASTPPATYPSTGLLFGAVLPCCSWGKIQGALVVPLVSGYPEAKMEIIAAEKIMDVLKLKVGDLVKVPIL